MVALWIVFALLSAAVFSAKDIIIKRLFNHHEMTPTNAVVQEYVAYLILTIAFIPLVNFKAFIPHWELFVLKALFIGAVGYLYFTLLEKHNISMVAPLLNLSPVFLILFSAVFLSEAATWMQIGGILLIVIATYYLEVVLAHHNTKKAHKKHWYQIKKKDVYFFGTVLAMLIIISLTAITDKVLLGFVNWQTNLFFMSIIILIIYTIIKKPITIVQSVKLFKKHPLSIAFTVTNVISTIFILLAMSIPSALVSLIVPLRRTSTLFTSIFGGLLFHEDHLVKKVLSVLVMLAGIILIVI